MTDRVQVGVRVDADLWQEFRDDIEARKGQTRGVLGDELETALREYLYNRDELSDAERLRRIDERVGRIENKLGTVESDGGTPTVPETDVHAHTPNGPNEKPAANAHTPNGPNEKPAANAPRAKKVAWLVDIIVEEHGHQGDPARVAINHDSLEQLIVDAYDFGDRTVAKYKDRIIDRLDLWEHPNNDRILLGPAEYERQAGGAE